MRAALLESEGGVPIAREAPEPAPEEGLELVSVRAAALNPLDLLIGDGRWYGATPRFPYVPGTEGVGALADGRRVWFLTPARRGSFAERCTIDRTRAVELPQELPDEVAVCLGVAGLAAWLALAWRAHVQPGETVLVLGASGAVGTFAIQLAKLMGARRVVAAARDRDALERARSLGADATVDLASTEDLAGAFRAAADGGVDVTIDPLWGAPAAAAASAAAKGGRLVQLGQSAGAEATFSSAAVRGNKLAILGYSNFDVPLPEQAAAYRELARHALAGSLRVEYDCYPLERVGEAWERQRRGAYRKLVIVPRAR